MKSAPLLLLALLALPAAAQERTAAERQTLVSLGYVLGEAHALKYLCEGKDSQGWRSRMQRLLELEQPDQKFKRRLEDSFNEGFTYREAQHAECDDAARAAVTETARRGRDIAQSVVRASVASAGMAATAPVR